MSNERITAHIIETGQSLYSNNIVVSNHNILADEPADISNGGGQDLGPAPFDLLVSALGTCTVMTMRWYAQAKNLPLEKAEAFISFDKKTNHFTKEIILHGSNLTDTDKQKLIEVAGKCPVQRTITGQITIETLMKEAI